MFEDRISTLLQLENIPLGGSNHPPRGHNGLLARSGDPHGGGNGPPKGGNNPTGNGGIPPSKNGGLINENG
jgi:hypothetical protein